MKYLQIRSKGEMQIEALTLIGASTKRGDDSSIGMFGSGLKYAIASIIRQEIPFLVFSGKKEIKITTEVLSFGGKQFNRILVNGEPTSLTDSMGTEDWNGAFPFIREIYSNALDEDKDATIEIVENFGATEGYTTFLIQVNDEITNLFTNFSDYFTKEENNLWKTSTGEIHPAKKGIKIYRKGILAYGNEKIESIFSYNCFHVEINESRIIKNIYSVHNEVGLMLESCQNKNMLRQWITGLKGGNAGQFEHDCILPNWYSKANNPMLIDVILENNYYPVMMGEMFDDSEKEGRYALPMKLLKRFLAYCPDVDILGITVDDDNNIKNYIECKPPMCLFNDVQDAIERLKVTAYKERLSSKIKYCKFHKKETLGQAVDGTIFLSIKLDTYSIDEICKIIIEEQEHIHSGFGDETRNFQNHIFNLYFKTLTQKQ